MRSIITAEGDTGYWILELDTGFWIQDTGYWIAENGYGSLIKTKTLNSKL